MESFMFQEKKFEKCLYEVLRVKKWKDKMPTFAPEMLDFIDIHGKKLQEQCANRKWCIQL